MQDDRCGSLGAETPNAGGEGFWGAEPPAFGEFYNFFHENITSLGII